MFDIPITHLVRAGKNSFGREHQELLQTDNALAQDTPHSVTPRGGLVGEQGQGMITLAAVAVSNRRGSDFQVALLPCS